MRIKITLQGNVLLETKMPKKHNRGMMKVPRDAVLPFCKDCGKTLTNKEFDMHVYVCEKVPQEIFNDNYFNTPLGGSSVSTGTNCNSSLTNPLLGGRPPPVVVPPPPSDK